MKKEWNRSTEQPMPFTRGLSREKVCEHAIELYHDKLLHGGHLTLEDWVLAEKDLISVMEAEGLLTR
jgi:hypothetical protein